MSRKSSQASSNPHTGGSSSASSGLPSALTGTSSSGSDSAHSDQLPLQMHVDFVQTVSEEARALQYDTVSPQSSKMLNVPSGSTLQSPPSHLSTPSPLSGTTHGSLSPFSALSAHFPLPPTPPTYQSPRHASGSAHLPSSHATASYLAGSNNTHSTALGTSLTQHFNHAASMSGLPPHPSTPSYLLSPMPTGRTMGGGGGANISSMMGPLSSTSSTLATMHAQSVSSSASTSTSTSTSTSGHVGSQFSVTGVPFSPSNLLDATMLPTPGVNCPSSSSSSNSGNSSTYQQMFMGLPTPGLHSSSYSSNFPLASPALHSLHSSTGATGSHTFGSTLALPSPAVGGPGLNLGLQSPSVNFPLGAPHLFRPNSGSYTHSMTQATYQIQSTPAAGSTVTAASATPSSVSALTTTSQASSESRGSGTKRKSGGMSVTFSDLPSSDCKPCLHSYCTACTGLFAL